MGLTADGKFGPGSALLMAKEVAVLPWVRYFPLNDPNGTTKAGALAQFRGRLRALALTIKDTTHAAALLRAADQETGKGWPATVTAAAPAVPPTIPEIESYVKRLEAAIAAAKK